MTVKENIQEVAKLCDRVAEGINKRNRGVPTIGWLCDTRKADRIANSVALDCLYKEMIEYFNLPDRLIHWSQQRKIFLDRL